MPSILTNRSLVEIKGEDAVKFLQNLITNDIYSEKPIYAMMLSPQGRFLFDIFIIKVEDGFLLDVAYSTKDILLQKLNMYKLNSKVSIEEIKDGSKIGYISLSLERKLASSNNTIDSLKWVEDNGALFYKDPRYEKLGYRFITQKNIVEDNSYIQDKYSYSIPDGGVDLLYDKAMPQEYGAEELNAISYNKGCYVGQEVISRTKTQGQVRKKIYKITSSEGLEHIPHGTEIISNEKKIGIFCSGFGNIGIGLIREENIKQNSTIFVDNIEVKIQRAEWYK